MELFVTLAALGLWLAFDGATGPRRSLFLIDRVENLTGEAGLKISPRALLCTCGLLGLIASALSASVGVSTPLVSVAGCAGSYAPIARARSLRLKRRRAHREAWPDTIAALIAVVRSGTSIGAACSDLADRSPDRLREPWEAFRSRFRATGDFALSVRDMTERAADPVADRVGAVLITVHDVGGTELVPVLQALGASVRAELRLVREIEARWSWTVTAARVAAAAPWIVLVLMSTRPEAAAAYMSPEGGLLMLGGALATLLGYRAMLRAARLPAEGRLAR